MGGGLRLQLSIHHTGASRRWLAERRLKRAARNALLVARHSGRVVISLAFVGDDAMRQLNRRFAGNDYVTDVLSFAAREWSAEPLSAPSGDEAFLGEIVIALPQAARQAKAAGQPLAREVDGLLVHGVLHLLGYDHAHTHDSRRMRGLEQRALRRKKFLGGGHGTAQHRKRQ